MSTTQTTTVIKASDAVAYINDEPRALKFLQTAANYGSWVKPSVASGARNIKFRKTTFGSAGLGEFGASGYTDMDYTVSWVDAKLDHDSGNSLKIDVVDDGASLGGDIVALYNNYVARVFVPGTSAHVYSDVLATSGITSANDGTLTTSNIVATILADLAALEEQGIDVSTAGLELRVNPSIKALLLEIAMGKGQFTLGGYAFNFGANPTEFQGITIITVPSAQLGSNVNYILAPKDAVGVYFIFNDAKYFDAVPGYGSRRHQVDVGAVFGAIVCPGCESYVYVSKSTAAATD